MTLGLTSKILVFVLILNSVVAFAGIQGMLGSDVDWKKSRDILTQFRNNTADVTKDIKTEDESGIIGMDFFNPLSKVWGWINMVIDFFTNPIALAWVLPMPLNWIFGLIISMLEGAAIVGIVRGVVV